MNKIKVIVCLITVASLFSNTLVAESKADLIHQLIDAGVVKKGHFKLKSGVETSVYIDIRRTFSYPTILKHIAQELESLSSDISFDHVCPVPYGAIPLATSLSLHMNKSLIFPRKEVKTYGTKNKIEGVFKTGDSCLIIEDVIVSGESILETISMVESCGLKVAGIVIIVDRQAGGKELLMSKGYKVFSLLTLEELL